MDCKAFSAMLDNYSDLTKEEIAMLEEHSTVCESCRKELEFFRSVIDITASLPQIEPPEDLLTRINDEIDRSKPAIYLNKVYYNIKTHVKQYSTIAACLLVGLIVGLNNSSIKDMLHNEPTHHKSETSVSETEKKAPEIPQLPDNDAEKPVDMPSVLPGIPELGKNTDKDDSADNAISVPGIKAPSNETAKTDINKKSSDKTEAAPTPKPVLGNRIPAADQGKKPSVKAELPVVPEVTKTPAKSEEKVIEPVQGKKDEAVVTDHPEVTADSQVSTVGETEKESFSGVEKYTLEEYNYSMPKDEYAYSEPEPSPTETVEVEDYEIAEETYGVALKDTKEGIYDKLIILQGDTSTVSEVLGNYNISYVGPYYRTSLVEFQEFLSGLDGAGIYYSYVCMRGEEAAVLFTIGQ